MTESNDPSPEVPDLPSTSESAPPDEPEAPAKRTFRDRVSGVGTRLNGTRGLIAATLAALIVGGVGGAAVHAAVEGDRHEHGRFLRGERPGERGDFRDFGERPGPPRDFYRQAPPGFPGEVPPTTTPDDEDSPPTPSPSESSDS